MLSNNKLALGLSLLLVGCAGGGTPLLPAPSYGDAPQGGYPQTDPRTTAPLQTQPAPLAPDEFNGGPPPSKGPSGTSDRGSDRYDEVGYATWYGSELAGSRTASGAPFDPKGFTAAHRTLPLGSFVEVTSLDTGRTIVVEINDRGQQQTNLLIDLSQGAAQALGIKSRGAVRVRRIVPTPSDQTALRNGQPGSPRLDTPPALLSGLRQRLPGSAMPGAIPTRRPIPRVTPEPQGGPVRIKPTPLPARQPAPAPVPRPVPAAPVAKGSYYVQVAAFGSKERATALARSLGGVVAPTGSLWRVRVGPFATPKQAAQARDGIAARGYGDARIVRED